MATGDSVQQIKDRLSIVDVVSAYVELHKAGKSFKGKSPFTNEKTPSFYVSPDRGMYYCFSSSQGGDIFTFVQAMEGVDFKGALKILADKAGVELVPEDPKKRTERDRQYDVLEEATKFFQKKLVENKDALKYLDDRGVTGETRAKWRIGYAPGPPNHGWRELKNFLEDKKYTQAELLRAGLIKGLDTGKEPYDVFRDRIMFPISDAGGRVVAYSGRILDKDSEAPKYVNSPETELFVKSDILYGYDKAKEGMRKLNFALIVEGQFDVVLAHQAGYTNTVAVSGTALTPHHVDIIQRLTNRVVLALDDDRAGISAVKRAADLMLGRSMDVKVASMKAGEDPADMIRADVDGFKETIKTASPVVEYLLKVLERDKRDDRTFKLLVRDEVLPYVAKIQNAIDREHFEALIARRLDTTVNAIHLEVQKILEATPSSLATTEADVPRPSSEISVNQLDSYAEQLFGALYFLEKFTDEAAYQNFKSELQKIHEQDFRKLLEVMGEERLNKVIMQFERTYQEFPDAAFFENLAAKLNHYHELLLKKKLQEHKTVMRELESMGETAEEHAEVLKKAQEIQIRLSNYQISTEDLLHKKG